MCPYVCCLYVYLLRDADTCRYCLASLLRPAPHTATPHTHTAAPHRCFTHPAHSNCTQNKVAKVNVRRYHASK